jgi:hypothetical protein
MTTTFENLVEQVRACSHEEKEELRFLLEQALVEERREEILQSYRESRDEEKRGRIKFSSKVADMKKLLR